MGAISGIVAGLIGGQSVFALGLAVLVTLSVCGLLPRLRDSSRVAGITVVIVILAGHPAESPITLGLSRFTEISIGIITALATSALVFPSRASAALGRGLAKVFEDVASLFAVVVEGRLREDYPERHVFALKDRLVRTLNRCRQLRLEADIEGRREDAAIRDMLLLPVWDAPALAAMTARELVEQGLAAFATGRYAQAREQFLAARARAPDAPAILYDLGTTAYRLGDTATAAHYFARAAQAASGPLRAKALYNQGNAVFRQGDFAEAIRLYQAVLAATPGDDAAKANLALARSRLQTGGQATTSSRQTTDTAATPGAATPTRETGPSTAQSSGQASQGQDDPGHPTQEAQVPTGPDATGPGDRLERNAGTVPLAAREGMLAIHQDAPVFDFFDEDKHGMTLLALLHLAGHQNVPDLRLPLRLEVKRIRHFAPMGAVPRSP